MIIGDPTSLSSEELGLRLLFLIPEADGGRLTRCDVDGVAEIVGGLFGRLTLFPFFFAGAFPFPPLEIAAGMTFLPLTYNNG